MLAKVKETGLQAKPDDEFFEYLRNCIDELCCKVAEKYKLYDSYGRPRRAFILDTLIKYACRGCIVKVLTQLRRDDDVDRLFVQNHKLAVNLLVEQLRSRLGAAGLKGKIEEEANGAYGRPDILIKLTSTGLVIKVGDVEIIVEVKTGKGFSYAQLFRYLIERPNAVLVLCRVAQHQSIVIKGTEIHDLLVMVMEAALSRGIDILNGGYEECNHNPVSDSPYVVENAQAIVDSFLASLPKTTQSNVDVILSIIEGCIEKGSWEGYVKST